MKMLNLTDGQKMVLVTAVIGAILVSVGGIFAFGEFSRRQTEQTTSNARTISTLATQAQTSLLEARRREKDFQIRKLQKYADGVPGHIADLQTAVDGLKAARLGDAERKSVESLPVLASHYLGAFDGLAKSLVRLGLTEKEGLQGTLREAVHQIEATLKKYRDADLRAGMLMMRRREKDFIMRVDEKYLTLHANDADTFSALLAAKKGISTADKGEISGLLTKYVAAFNAYAAGAQEVEVLGGKVSDAAHEIEPVLEKLQKNAAKTLALENSKEAERRVMIRWMLGATLGLGSFGILFLVFWLTRGIKKSIAGVVASLLEASSSLGAASNQVAGSSQGLAEGASEQAASLEETSSTLEEMASMTRQNSDHAKQADLLAQEARGSSTKGQESMTGLMSAIDAIKRSSDQTAKIIKTIDEIAFQTNLLALNAAVEAARAGDVGKGFAVVAEEVRNLAQRSAEAAKTTSDLIQDSQEKSDSGVNKASEVEKLLGEVNASVEKVGDLLREVSAASDEQAKGVDQVNAAVAQMDQVTQSNAANAEETAAASQELSSQAIRLNEIVGMLAGMAGVKTGDGNGHGNGVTQPGNGAGEHPKAAARPKTRAHAPEKSLKDLIIEDVEGSTEKMPPEFRDLEDGDFSELRN